MSAIAVLSCCSIQLTGLIPTVSYQCFPVLMNGGFVYGRSHRTHSEDSDLSIAACALVGFARAREPGEHSNPGWGTLL